MKLRAVSNERDHARDIARRLIKGYRNPDLPIVNQHDTQAPPLQVDEILRRSEPQHDRRQEDKTKK